jgi:hypothetical protein
MLLLKKIKSYESTDGRSTGTVVENTDLKNSKNLPKIRFVSKREGYRMLKFFKIYFIDYNSIER